MNKPPENSSFDLYLTTLARQLRFLPPEMKEQYDTEIRQHLEAIAQERIVSGVDPDNARQFAMATFGDPKKIGREIFAEIGWGTGIAPGSLALAVVSGVIWLFVFQAVFLIGLGMMIRLFHLSETQSNLLSLYPQILINYIVAPCFAGLITGLVAPKSAPKGMLFAVVTSFLCNTFAVCLDFNALSTSSPPWRDIASFVTSGCCQMACGYMCASYSSFRLRGLQPTLLPPRDLPKGGIQ